MLRPFSLHPALGQALLHNATLPASAASAMTVGLSRRLLSRVVGTGNRCVGRTGGCGPHGKCACYEDRRAWMAWTSYLFRDV